MGMFKLISITSLGPTEAILYRNLKINIFTCSNGVLLREKLKYNGALLKDTITASTTYSSPAPGSVG